MFQATGRIRYSEHKEDAKWWMVVDCDPEIGKYYRSLFAITHYHCKTLFRPAWEAHISVIRGEKPPNDKCHLWRKYDGQLVKYYYDSQARGDDVYVWLDVECDFLLDIREEMGLPRHPMYSLHLTIGNLKHI